MGGARFHLAVGHGAADIRIAAQVFPLVEPVIGASPIIVPIAVAAVAVAVIVVAAITVTATALPASWSKSLVIPIFFPISPSDMVVWS